MYYTFPDYINEFKCTADLCPDTCCAGWKICVDRDSLKRYRKVRGRYMFKIIRSVDFAGHTFRHKDGKRCAFLRADGLCDMYMNLGPDALCRTCRNYPRRVEKYENVREVTLSLSCPEVARLLMRRREPVRFISKEDDRTEEIPGSDPLLYSAVSELKNELYGIFQDRRIDIETRCGLAFAVCNDVQVKIHSRQLFSCGEVFDKYKRKGAKNFVSGTVKSFMNDTEKYYAAMRSAFLSLYRFEPLKEEWPNMILRSEEFLYNGGADNYRKMTGEFNEWTSSDDSFQIRMEQLLVYYVSAYMSRAADDGDVLSKIHMALIPAAIIHELAMSYWYRNNKQLSAEDMSKMAYRLSREIEHSDDNLKQLGECRFMGDRH